MRIHNTSKKNLLKAWLLYAVATFITWIGLYLLVSNFVVAKSQERYDRSCTVSPLETKCLQMRVDILQHEIDSSKVYGGHGAIPARVINMQSVDYMKKRIHKDDVQALTTLALSQDYTTRVMAGILLECILGDDLARYIEKYQKTHNDPIVRDYLSNVLLDAQTHRASNTQCKWP